MFDPVEVPFRIPIGAPFPVAVVDAERALSRFELRIRVTPDVWRQVIGNGLFNLRPEVRNAGEVSGDRDVEIDIRLADDLVADVVATVAFDDPRAAVERLAALALADPAAPAVQTEHWFALRATEAVELPAELAGQGSVRSGFTTTWAGAERVESTDRPVVETVVQTQEEIDTSPWPTLLAAVRDHLATAGIEVTRHARADMVSTTLAGDHGTWDLWVHSREEARQVLVYSVRPEPVPLDRRAAVVELVALLNLRLTVGNFEIDPDQGGFRYKTSIIVNEAELDRALLDGLIGPHVPVMDKGLAALDALLAGATTRQAVEEMPRPRL